MPLYSKHAAACWVNHATFHIYLHKSATKYVSAAHVKIVLNRESLNGMSQDGAVGGELFDGFDLLTKAQAKKILEDGVDEHGIYYSVSPYVKTYHHAVCILFLLMLL